MKGPSKWIYFFLWLALAYFASVVFIPLFLSVFSAILLEPIVARLERRDISRQVACTLVIIVFVAISGVTLWLGYRSIVILVQQSAHPDRVAHLTEWLRTTAEKIDFTSQPLGGIATAQNQVQKVQIVDPYPSWTHYLLRGVGSFVEVVSVALFVPLLLFYLLYDKSNLVESFNNLVGKYCYLPTLNFELPKMIRAFAAANIATFFFLIVAHGLALFAVGFSNWLALAVITAFVSLLPVIGAPLAIFIVFTQGTIATGGGEYLFLFISIGFYCFHLFAANFLLPYIIGARINVNSTAFIFGLLFWGWLWGAMGIILAVPMTALVKIFLESNPDTTPFANLLAARPKFIR